MIRGCVPCLPFSVSHPSLFLSSGLLQQTSSRDGKFAIYEVNSAYGEGPGDGDKKYFAQSEMMFRALKLLNRPVEYLRYPDIGHELTRSGPPNQRMDQMLRIIEFSGAIPATSALPSPRRDSTLAQNVRPQCVATGSGGTHADPAIRRIRQVQL